MRFWDASAIVPLLVAEAATRRLRALAAEDTSMLVWWGRESNVYRPWLALNVMARLPKERSRLR